MMFLCCPSQNVVTPMFSTTSLLLVPFLTSPAFGHLEAWEKRASSSFLGKCDQKAMDVSGDSQVFFARKWYINNCCASS